MTVTICDVAPRDGLQNDLKLADTAIRVPVSAAA